MTLVFLFTFAIGNVWAADTFVNLRTVDFTAMTKKIDFANGKNTISDAGYTDVEFYQKSTDKPLKLNNASGEGIDFGGQNIGNSHFVAIPLTGINGQLKVTVFHKYNSGKASFKLGLKTGTTTVTPGDYSTNAQTPKDGANADVSCSYTYGSAIIGTATTAVLFLGEAGTSYKQIKRVVVETLEASIDETAPTLASSVPANGATNVETSGTIVLTFSEAIDELDDTKFTMDNATIGTVAIDGTDAKKVNVAYSGAANSTTVTLHVAAGAVEDAANNASAALDDIAFTTKATVVPACPSGLTISGTAAYTEGQTISLTAALEAGNGGITYTWYKGSIAAGNEVGTGASFSKANCVAGDAGDYFCVASKDACASAESAAYAVTVAPIVACYTFTPTLPAETVTFAVNDIVPGSTGGSIKVLGNTMKNTAYGLSFESNSSAKVEVTLGSLMKIGTQISVTILADYKENNNRGLLLQNGEGTKKADWVWKPAENAIREAHNFTYTVQEGDGMVGTNVFRIARSTNAIITSLTVSNCGADLLELSSAIDPVHDPAYATVTLSKTLLAAGGTATATYSAIDPAYDFDEWQISGTGATLSSTTANPTTITMGSTDAVVTLKLKAASVKHTVTYYDGEAILANKLGEEEITEGGNPTGAGLAPKKRGFTFGGWSTTKGGTAIADYAAVTVNADMNLFAVWTQVACPANGTVFAFEMNNSAKPGAEVNAPANGTLVVDEYLTESGFGSAIIGNTASNQYASVKTTPNITLGGQTGYLNLALECALQAGDIITIAKNNTQIYISDEAGTSGPTGNKYTTASNSENVIIVGANATTAAWVGAMDLYFWYKGGGVNITGVSVVRPYTVSFDLNGQSATAIEDQKIAAGGKVTKPDDPVVTGQAFGGWFTDAACSEGKEWAFATATVSEDVVLYAKWTALPKMILNRGAATTGDAVVSYPTVGDPVAVPACPFTYEGYIFAGWVYSPSVTVEAGSFTMPNENLTLTAQWVSESAKVQIVETSAVYETLAEAIAAAEAGQTVKLLQDIEQADGVAIAKNLILDLNGKTYTCTSGSNVNSRAIKITAGDVTIKNGSIIAVPTANFEGGAYGPLRIEGATANVTLKDLTLQNGRHYGLGIKLVEGYLRMEDCTVISQNGGGGLEVGEATADVINCTFTQTGLDNAHAWISTCLATCDNGVLNVQGGTYTSDHYSMYVYTSGGEMNVESGSFTGDVVNQVTPSSYPDAVGTINITGGTFEGVGEEPIHFTTDNTGKTSIAISGGSFDAPVAEEYCATGYVPETKANGKYGVIVPAQSIDFEAIIDAKGTDATAIAELDAQLAAKHYDIDGTLNNDRLDVGEDKDADKGFKIKKTGLTISFSVEANKVVEITTGSLSGASISVDSEAAAPMTASHTHSYYSANAQAFLITMTAANDKYNIFKSIAIRDPYEVSFDVNGGDAPIAPRFATPSVTLPSASKGTDSFVGWFDGETKIGEAGESYTPTADITLVAHWEAVSTDARLSAIEFSAAGTLAPAFDPEVVNYTYTMPYGTADVPTITSATAVNPNAQAPVIDAQAAAWSETAHVHGVAQSGATKDYYVQMLRAPKDGICIIKSTPNSGTDAAVDGIYQGSAYFKGKAENKKLNSKYDYVAVELADGYTFQAGDKVVLNQAADLGDASDITKFYVFTEVPADGKSYVTVDNATPVKGDNWFEMPAELVGASALYIGRIDAKCNPTLGYLAVYRPLPPVLKKVAVNGVEGKPNALKQIEIEVPFSTSQSQLEAIAYDWVSNSDAWTAAHTPVATNTWEFGVADTVTLTDKDGDESVYTIMVNKATASTSVELATLSIDGNAITLVPGQAVYSYEYPYGTAETPAPVVAATAADNAEVGTITQAASKNGTATFTVTAEDGINYRDYTINISVSRIPAVVIYDGSTMTDIATKTGSDPTGLSWSMGSNVASSGYEIAGTWQGKNYTHAVKGFKANASANNLVSFVVPEDYMAKVRLVGSTNSDTKERSMFIAKEATNDASKAIENYVITSSTYDAQGFVTDFMLPGTYYLGSTDSYRLFEFSVQLYPIDYSRATTEGRYGTICLPNGGIMVGATLYEVAYYGQTSKKIFFDEILNGTMEAGVPYIFLPKEGASQLAVYYTDEANESAKNANGLHGFIGANADAEMNVPVGAYILNANQYRKVVTLGTAKIKSNRSYIELGEISPSEPALAPGRRRISMAVNGEQVATGIENTGFESEAPRKVLINGELYIIRGEKMYDAKGQLVK